MLRLLGLVTLAIAVTLWTPRSAPALVGDMPAGMSCGVSQTQVSLADGGVTRYSIQGSCIFWGEGGSNQREDRYFAQGAYDPQNQQAQEVVTGNAGWSARSAATCQQDPWLTGAPCSSPRVQVKGSSGSQLPNILRLRIGNADVDPPYSAHLPNVPRTQLAAQKAAAPPPPPPPPSPPPALPPGNVKAETDSDGRLYARWDIPADQSDTNRTVEWFEIERRLAGGMWVGRGRVAAHWRTFVDPERLQPGNVELRVCAANRGGKNCSGPALAHYAFSRDIQRGGKMDSGVKALGQPPAGPPAAAQPGPSSVARGGGVLGAARARAAGGGTTPPAPGGSQTPPVPSGGGSTPPSPGGGPVAMTPEDALAVRIVDQLKLQVPLLAPAIKVAVTAGSVADLRGTVPSQGDKKKVGSVVEGVPGVARVMNGLDVQKP
jgi:hypothetical protein